MNDKNVVVDQPEIIIKIDGMDELIKQVKRIADGLRK